MVRSDKKLTFSITSSMKSTTNIWKYRCPQQTIARRRTHQFVNFRWKYIRPYSQAAAKLKWQKLSSNPNTKSLSGFPEELNECAERVFAPFLKRIIDSLLYVNYYYHLKRSINWGCLENCIYVQLLAHLERKLELCWFGRNGELPIHTMATTTKTVNQQIKLWNAEHQRLFCPYCKKAGLVTKDCQKRIGKKQWPLGDKQSTERLNTKTYPPCPHCKRTNHIADMCWKGPYAANIPRRYKRDRSNDSTDDSYKPTTSTQNALTSVVKHPSNWKSHISTA